MAIAVCRVEVPNRYRHLARLKVRWADWGIGDHVGGRATPMSLLPAEPAYRLAEHADHPRWLVTGLWSEQAVGIGGGEPKCCKSFLALDLGRLVKTDTGYRLASA